MGAQLRRFIRFGTDYAEQHGFLNRFAAFRIISAKSLFVLFHIFLQPI